MLKYLRKTSISPSRRPSPPPDPTQKEEPHLETISIEPFIKAVGHVFETYFQKSPKPGNQVILNKESKFPFDLTTLIGFAGDARGVAALSFGKDAALNIVGKLSGSGITELNDEVTDTLGEFINIVAGNAKQGLEPLQLVISLPTVVKGAAHQIVWPTSDAPILHIPFSFEFGDFALTVSLQKN